MKTYEPNPIKTDHIEIPNELLALIETLAEHAHDLWALGRRSEGWTLGEQRDDELKKHPCLVKYSDLPESEKKYDRKTVIGTIKAVLASGYSISKTD